MEKSVKYLSLASLIIIVAFIVWKIFYSPDSGDAMLLRYATSFVLFMLVITPHFICTAMSRKRPLSFPVRRAFMFLFIGQSAVTIIIAFSLKNSILPLCIAFLLFFTIIFYAWGYIIGSLTKPKKPAERGRRSAMY